MHIVAADARQGMKYEVNSGGSKHAYSGSRCMSVYEWNSGV